MNITKLRCCGSCEWIFKVKHKNYECPKCEFGSYSAHYVYGNLAYHYAKTQKPWYDKKMAEYSYKLHKVIKINSEQIDEERINEEIKELQWQKL